MTRILALIALQLLALAAFGQSDEFGRASGGSIDAITKAPRQFSGTLGMTRSSGVFRGNGYEGSLGGELLEDRMWVFAAASVLPAMQFSAPDLRAGNVNVTAQPVDWTTVTASFTQLQPQQPVHLSVPSSFLSLRSTSILSDRAMLSISVSQSR